MTTAERCGEAAGRGGRRGQRLIHRRGIILEGEFRPPDPADPADPAVVRPAIARLSCTFGWRRPLPDWVGLAIRVQGPPSEDTGQDLLLVSSAPAGVLWRQARRSREVLACTFSSVVRYRLRTEPEVVTAVPVTPRPGSLDALIAGKAPLPVSYRLAAATAPGRWRDLGELELIRQRPDDPDVRFLPPHQGAGRLAACRSRLYRWSQRRAAGRALHSET